ncbi:MAG TPA: S41 family peptidase [Bryobacteraceae bacterium]
MKTFCIALAFLSVFPLFGQQTPNGKDRLVAAGRLWVTVRYFHPHIADGAAGWDTALVRNLPAIRAAKSPAQYVRALQSMLDVLHDPATYAFVHSAQPTGSTSLKYETASGGTLIVSETSGKSESNEAGRLQKAIRQARGIVFDLRTDGQLSQLLDEPAVANELARAPLDGPGERIWVHHGLPPLPGSPASRFYSAFETKPGPHFGGDPAAKRHRLVFLIGQHSHLPALALALAKNGQATILSDSAHYAMDGVETMRIDMGMGVKAVIRLSEPVFADGTGMPEIQQITPRRALEQATAALSRPAAFGRAKPLPAYPAPRIGRYEATTAYPSTGYRILAAYKIWGVFHYFFAYRDQMDEDWDADFQKYLPEIAGARDAQSYNLAIAEFVSRTRDSDTHLQSETLNAYFGEAPLGIHLRLIQNKPVVTDIVDPAARKAGLRPGDVVMKVDGETVSDRANREARYVPASTRQSLGYLVLRRVLNGPDGSSAALTIEDHDGQIKQIKLKRSKTFLSALRHQRSGAVVKILPGNIGYADLDRLAPDRVDAMFDRLQHTKAIVFDMRGSPHGTAGKIAARLAAKPGVPAAILTGILNLAPDLPNGEPATQSATYFFIQRVPRSAEPRYSGKTVMLIDERTMGLGERAALLFEAANRTRLIGSPSAGAGGDTTNFAVPGGIVISFSGLDVRGARGGQVQRLGLQPSFRAVPTIADIRTGRDEALDTAVEFLSQSR